MGKIERMVQTLEGVDDNDVVSVKPTFVLREEIMSLGAKTRNEMERIGYENTVAKEKFRAEIT